MSLWQLDNRVALENDLPRADIKEKVTGRARYTTDHYLPRMMWAAYIRCPFGNARLVSSNDVEARAVVGVLDVAWSKKEGDYAGARMGHLCAESPEALEAGLVALAPTYEMSQPKTDIDREIKAHGGLGTKVDKGKLISNLAGAKSVKEATYNTEVQVHCSLEPHGTTVDCQVDHATVWTSTQGTFGVRGDLVRTLGLPIESIEVHCEYVGGGFGSKFGAGPDATLAARLSKKFERPCRVVLNRREEMEDGGMRPGSCQYFFAGVTGEGVVPAAHIHTCGSIGASGGGGGVKISRYNFGKVDRVHDDIKLNSQPPKAMRAPGHPQGMFGEAMFMDELAKAAGMDPLTFRKKNDPNATRKEMVDVGASLIGWDRRKADGAWPGILKKGFGLAAGDWGNRIGKATVEVHLYRTGRVEVFNGSQDIGTGFRAVLRDTVASQLGLPGESVVAKVGVSSYPHGPGSGGSQTTRSVAPKALQAGQQARQVLLGHVARDWKVSVDQLELVKGVVQGAGRTMTWTEACALLPEERVTLSDSDGGAFGGESTQSEAVQFAEVDVDTETGIIRVVKVVALQEMGLPINRLAAENQINGAVVQGLSFALFENRILERKTGALINANMEWYKIAGSADIPEIVPILWRSAPNTPPNSLGEPPAIPTAGAIACAVANAVGVPVRQLPLTPARVLAALEQV